ncbi:MAG: hypothetical protein HN380_11015 [Victivallales bacterium]|jgi:neutral ceramidase|nr:hypothetical protein [Victivallales bacterium]
MQAGLSAGVAIRDISPATPQLLHGYSARDSRSLGIREPLSLRCLAVGDGQRTVLVICLDMIGVQHHVCQRWYELLESETGIGFPHILISCTHTHFAPAVQATIYANPATGLVEPDPAHVALVETQLVGAAREALARLQPAVLERVCVPVPGLLFNRRPRRPDGMVTTSYLYPGDDTQLEFLPTDDELAVLRFRGEHGIIGALTNFGCHPVTGTDAIPEGERYISADYPHYLRAELGGAWKCPVLFALGAAGDTVPINRQGECRMRIGRALADTAILAERRYRPDPVVHVGGECRLLSAAAMVPVDAATAADRFEQSRGGASYGECAQGLYRSRLYPSNRFDIPVQEVRLGSVSLVALPFEVFSEISLRMKAAFPNSLLLSCAGGYQGYLPLAHECVREGYGATPESMHFASDTGDRVLAEIEALLGQSSGAAAP